MKSNLPGQSPSQDPLFRPLSYKVVYNIKVYIISFFECDVIRVGYVVVSVMRVLCDSLHAAVFV